MSEEQSTLELGAEFLTEVFGQLETSIDIASRTDGDCLVYELTGSTQTLLSRPELVSALTLLTSQTVSRQIDRRVNCLLDVDGRLEARRALLETAATDVARAVVKNGRRAVFQGLTSSERRVVHTVLKDEEGVKTYSEGDDRARLLMVEGFEES
jgi:spoIIIJ-associated protein